MIAHRLLLAVATVGLLSSCIQPEVEADTAPAIEQSRVERVVDGDTLVLENKERIRLIGVDTPEVVKPNSSVECYGPEASAFTRAQLPKGTTVTLEYDKELRDRYDRKLAYVYRTSDRLFINAELVRGGYAESLTVKPNTAHKQQFEALQRAAKTAKRGMWSACLMKGE